jgi:hypothetical protein
MACSRVPCPHCGRSLTPSDSILFGIVHVECLLGEPREPTEDRVLDFLRERREPVCCSCLAVRLQDTYLDVAHAVKRLRVTDILRVDAGVCSICATLRVRVTATSAVS